MINITFPDGNVRQYEPGTTPLQMAGSISEGLARNVFSATVNGKLTDRNLPLSEDATVVFHTWRDDKGKETFWHSTAHLMAEALEALYPGIKFGYGPAGENGFFYDVMPPEGTTISSDDFPRIEAKMLELARQKNDYERREISKAEAV